MRVGHRIREACEIVDASGGCTSARIKSTFPAAHSNAFTYLSRAVALGLLTIDRSVYPHLFTAVPGWRSECGPRKNLMMREPRPAPAPGISIVQQALQTQVNSVFQLGTRNR